MVQNIFQTFFRVIQWLFSQWSAAFSFYSCDYYLWILMMEEITMVRKGSSGEYIYFII